MHDQNVVLSGTQLSGNGTLRALTLSEVIGKLIKVEKETERLMVDATDMVAEGASLTFKDERVLYEMLDHKVSSRDRARTLLTKLAKENPGRYTLKLEEVIAEDVFC